MTRIFTAFLALTSLALTAQNEPLDSAIDSWHLAASQADSSTYFAFFADAQSIFQGTDATEYWTAAEFAQWAGPYFRGESAWTFTPIERRWHEHQGVKWFSERLSSSHMGLCRGTGIMIETENGWKLDHYSLSFEVPNPAVNEIVPLLHPDRIAVLEFQQELNAHYKDQEQSPLSAEDRKAFQGHEFFDYDPKFRVVAEVELTPEAEVFDMATSSGKTKKYRSYGIARFEIDGQSYALHLYESMRLKAMPEYQDHLFLPFKDVTTGTLSYGTGRFLDLTKPSAGTSLVIDFNQCYNPYCAYSDGYSCPITPSENTLNTAITAGIKGPATH